MFLQQSDSIENDNRIKQLQKRRVDIEKQTQQRKQEIEFHSGLDYEKIQKENEFLIQDKYSIEERNNKLFDLYQALKINVMKQVGQLKISADALTNCKQDIYEHILRHKAKDAELFLRCTNTQPKDVYQLIEENQLQGPQVQEKEREIEALRLQNEKLKSELEFQKNQQQYIREYQNNPNFDQEIVKKMEQQSMDINKRQSTNKNDRSNSQLSYEAKQILDSYTAKQNKQIINNDNKEHQFTDQLEFV